MWNRSFGTALFLAISVIHAKPCSAEPPRIEFVGFLSDPNRTHSLGGAHGVAVSPDGRDVYVASFDDNALVVLARNQMTGAITFTEAHLDQKADVSGLFRPVSVVASPDGAHVYVGAFFGDAVATFRRDPSSGRLSFVEAYFGGAVGQRGLTQVRGLAMAPEGTELYVASYGDNAVTVMRREPASGRLTLTQVLRDANDGGTVEGLFRPTAIAVSPDGEQVFVAAGGSSSLAVFRRDPVTGLLAPLQTFFEGSEGVIGLEGAIAVTISPDGASVYVLGTTGLAHFRKSGDGRCTFAEALAGFEVVGSGEPSGPTAVAMAPQGSALVLSRGGDDTLVLLDRDQRTGALTVADTRKNQQDGVEGIAGAADLAFEPTGRWLYVAAQFDDAVAFFRRWPRCPGDCDENGVVTVEELVGAVHSLLANGQPLSCWQADRNGDERITVEEIVRAVRAALADCSGAP